MNKKILILISTIVFAAVLGILFIINRPSSCIKEEMRKNHTDEAVADRLCQDKNIPSSKN